MCDFCRDRHLLGELQLIFDPMGKRALYCPVCGEYLEVANGIEAIKRYLSNEIDRMIHPQETVEIDGEVLVVDREKPKPKEIKTKSTPINMAMDLETIDISREMAMLNKISFDEKFPPEVIQDSVERAMKDKGFL